MDWSGLVEKRAWRHCFAITYLDVAETGSLRHRSIERAVVAAAAVAVARMLAVLEVEKLHESCGRVPLVARVVAFAPACSAA